MLKQHYRAPLPFRLELLDEAKQIRAKLNNFVHYEMADRPEGGESEAVGAAIDDARAAFRAALEDDLNTSEAFAVVHGFMTAVNKLEPGGADAERAVAFMREMDGVLGVLDEAPAGAADADVERLIEERNAARKAKDFARADAIRDELDAKGIELLDSADGTRWRWKKK